MNDKDSVLECQGQAIGGSVETSLCRRTRVWPELFCDQLGKVTSGTIAHTTVHNLFFLFSILHCLRLSHPYKHKGVLDHRDPLMIHTHQVHCHSQ